MRAIYEPKGKALEYCERAANLYRGCGHGCLYCYAPGALRMRREVFDQPQARLGVIDALRKDAPKHSGREILLCFTTDPYCPGANGTTSEAIRILQSADCRVTVLTKGGMRSASDLDLLRPGVDRYGATLTFVDDADSREWEPNAALPAERIEALTKAKGLGISTWASLEPVIDPEQSLELIRATDWIVDLCKIGKWNHDARANTIDWRSFAQRAVALCEKQGREYVLKRDLAKYL